MKPQVINPRKPGRAVFSLFLLFALLPVSAFSTAAPQIITSITPLYALATVIAGNNARVELLINDGSSPHSFRLQPSAALALQQADLVIWIGPDLEGKLARPLHSLVKTGHLLTVIDLPLPVKLHNRHPGMHDEHEHSKNSIDPHVWLDPDNAAAIATAIADWLAEIDPDNAEHYRANLAPLLQSIKAADQRVAKELKPVQSRHFIILHDALQYFGQHYGLGTSVALTINSNLTGSAKRLMELKSTINNENISCILYEPMPDLTIVDVLLEGTRAHAVKIDPLGLSIPLEKLTYPELLEHLAKTVYGCLSDEKQNPASE